MVACDMATGFLQSKNDWRQERKRRRERERKRGRDREHNQEGSQCVLSFNLISDIPSLLP